MKTPPSRISLAPLILACAAAVVVTTTSAHAQTPCSYDVQIIASPLDCGLGTVNTVGLGLNENGAVVGYYKCPLWENFQGFMWSAEEGFEALDPPQGVVEVFPRDINNNGIICGTVRVSGVGNRGFVYDNGEWTILPPVVDVPGARSSGAAINNAGTVVGQRSLTKDPTPENAYIWSADKGFTDLGVMNGPNSAATDVNEIDQICGWTGSGIFALDTSGFLWNSGELVVFGPVPRGLQSTAFALNEAAPVVGSGSIPEDGHPFGIPRAFLWQRGKFTMLGTLPDHLISRAQDIRTNPQQIVGRSWNVDDIPTIAHGFIWEEGVMYDLNDFISGEYGVLIEGATGISATGEIIANGDDAAGEIVAFYLTPAPAPLGDLDGDCAVGVVDLLMLLKNWGACHNCNECDGDLDNNCVVGVSDLLILLGNWGSK